MAFSVNLKVLAVIPYHKRNTAEAVSVIRVYNNIATSENNILKEGGPYEWGQISITDQFCIRKYFVPKQGEQYKPPEDCIYIKIMDLELDGLSSPGNVGVFVDGE